jgi:hypothetical protein
MLVHQEIRLHGLPYPIRSALALPLMFYYVFPQDEPNLQERLEGPKRHRHIVEIHPGVYIHHSSFVYNLRAISLGLSIRFPGVTSRIPDPDQLMHSGRILRVNSRIPDAVCGSWRTDSVGSQCVEVNSSSVDFFGIREVGVGFGRFALSGLSFFTGLEGW